MKFPDWILQWSDLRSSRLWSTNTLGGLLSVSAGAYVLIEALDFSRIGSFMPNLVGWLLIVLGTALVLLQIIKPESGEVSREAVSGSYLRKISFIVLMSTWVAIIPKVGFLMTAILGLSATILIVPQLVFKRSVVAIEIAIATVIFSVIYGGMRFLLDVEFPSGWMI